MPGSRVETIRGRLEPASTEAKHLQLKRILAEHARTACKPGQAIPSERDLTRHFGVLSLVTGTLAGEAVRHG